MQAAGPGLTLIALTLTMILTGTSSRFATLGGYNIARETHHLTAQQTNRGYTLLCMYSLIAACEEKS